MSSFPLLKVASDGTVEDYFRQLMWGIPHEFHYDVQLTANGSSKLFHALNQGHVDTAAALYTITAQRMHSVQFTNALAPNTVSV